MAGLIDNLRVGLARLSGRQKLQIVIAVLALVAAIWGVSLYAARVRYGVLFTHVRPEDAGSVLTALQDRQIPYRVTGGGRTIEVPVEQVDSLRMELAGEGALPGSGVGFEIFDKPSFGLSDFVQNVNYQRALERELGRTILSLDSVDSARVHLALPAESVFAEERREPSASVVVRLKSGGSLGGAQVRAITHMVASGVEGLQSNRVSVVDGSGRLLSDDGSDPDSSLTASQLERKRALEQGLERTLVSILEPLVGPGRVRATATVELSMTQISRVEERYDPDGAVVRSEQRQKSEQRAGGPGGVPGTATNLPGGTGATGAAAGPLEKSQNSTTNFEINKTVSTIREPAGTLARQSVAVVVDNALEPDPADREAEPTARPRTPEEMRQITDIVQASIGFDRQRGDTLIVENVAFDGASRMGEEEPAGGVDMWAIVLRLVRYLSAPLAILLLVLLAIRPGIQALRKLGEHAVDTPALPSGPMTVDELQAQLAAGGLPQPSGAASSMREKLLEATAQDPKTAAMLVRDWLEPQGND